jgi:hypothetical protein
MLGAGVAAAAGAVLGRGRRARAAATHEVLELRTISPERDLYHGWPTLARSAGGRLYLVCSGGREEHVCPFGRVEMMESGDGGRTWTWPRVLHDGPIDDRDAGVLATRRGSVLVTTFTSLAWKPVLERAEAAVRQGKAAWPKERLERWRAAAARLDAKARREELGCWILRSADGGRSFGAIARCPVNSPHGPIELADGRLLYAGKRLWDDEAVGIAVSEDDGAAWRWQSALPARAGDDPKHYHELHAVETREGRIIIQIRNHNPANDRETLQSESTDGGKTWSVPRAIGVWGLPSHLLRLRDGRLLMSYSHRRPPFGCQARLSADGARTWSEPMLISGDGIGGDLGYPSTVELDDGALVTAWYEVRAESPKAALRLARWRLAPA